jgi:hypothetical protein
MIEKTKENDLHSRFSKRDTSREDYGPARIIIQKRKKPPKSALSNSMNYSTKQSTKMNVSKNRTVYSKNFRNQFNFRESSRGAISSQNRTRTHFRQKSSVQEPLKDTLDMSITDKRTIEYGAESEMTRRQAPFSIHSYFAPTRFHRQPHFKMLLNPLNTKNTSMSYYSQLLKSELMNQCEDVQATSMKHVKSLKLLLNYLFENRANADNAQNLFGQDLLQKISRIDTLTRRSNSAGLLEHQKMTEEKLMQKDMEFNLNVFDPFLDFELVKGMVNPLLSSKRTNLNENNMVSETLKIVHNMFGKQKMHKISRKYSGVLKRSVSQMIKLDLKFISNLISNVNLTPNEGKIKHLASEKIPQSSAKNFLTVEKKKDIPKKMINEDLNKVILPTGKIRVFKHEASRKGMY